MVSLWNISRSLPVRAQKLQIFLPVHEEQMIVYELNTVKKRNKSTKNWCVRKMNQWMRL